MKFISIRDLRSNTAQLRKDFDAQAELLRKVQRVQLVSPMSLAMPTRPDGRIMRFRKARCQVFSANRFGLSKGSFWNS